MVGAAWGDGRLAAAMARNRTPKVHGAPAVSSSMVLTMAMVLTATATALILLRLPRIAGGLALAAGAAILWGWFLAQGEGHARSRLTSMLVDPLYDSALLASLAWVTRITAPRTSVLALVALGLCYVASYERARADALGFRTFESVGYRAARVALISVGLLANLLTIALWLLIALSGAAVAVRAANVAVQHRRTKDPAARRARRARSPAP
jgi:hypothetical protein